MLVFVGVAYLCIGKHERFRENINLTIFFSWEMWTEWYIVLYISKRLAYIINSRFLITIQKETEVIKFIVSTIFYGKKKVTTNLLVISYVNGLDCPSIFIFVRKLTKLVQYC